jgi:two-component system response regulator HydG
MKTKEGNILIVDDDIDVLFTAKLLLGDYYKKIQTVSEPSQLPDLVASGGFDLVLLDMNYAGSETSGKEGIKWLNKIKQIDPSIVVVMMTAYSSVDLAIQAIKQGAADFVVKPWQNEKLLATLSSAYELKKSKQTVHKLQNTQRLIADDIDKKFGEFIGASEAMKQLYTIIEKVAQTDANVLILGENGTGKELVARSIHRQSHRAKEALISVDLGSISDTLFESELFGHVKGAFTDAREDRAGRFEIASGSTLFLDEIGNLPLTLQSKLLTALQNRQVTRLGSNKNIPVDIRLICATNLPVYEKVDSGEFREDLLYRIKTIEIHLPPLREREGDIPLLASYFLDLYTKKYRKPTMKLSAETLSKLEKYAWPGNVRELQHAIERAVVMSDGVILKPHDFFFHESKKQSKSDTFNLEQNEQATIRRALEKHNDNISKAARDLGLTRAALYRRMEKYGIR